MEDHNPGPFQTGGGMLPPMFDPQQTQPFLGAPGAVPLVHIIPATLPVPLVPLDQLRIRKPYVRTKQREKWTDEEHQKFLEAIREHGRNWPEVQRVVGTKTAIQIRSHAQKYFDRLEKQRSGVPAPSPPPMIAPSPLAPFAPTAVPSGPTSAPLFLTSHVPTSTNVTTMETAPPQDAREKAPVELPPPRVKRKAWRPYPKKAPPEFEAALMTPDPLLGMNLIPAVNPVPAPLDPGLAAGGFPGLFHPGLAATLAFHQPAHPPQQQQQQQQQQQYDQAAVAAVAAAASAAAVAAAAAVMAAAGGSSYRTMEQILPLVLSGGDLSAALAGAGAGVFSYPLLQGLAPFPANVRPVAHLRGAAASDATRMGTAALGSSEGDSMTMEPTDEDASEEEEDDEMFDDVPEEPISLGLGGIAGATPRLAFGRAPEKGELMAADPAPAFPEPPKPKPSNAPTFPAPPPAAAPAAPERKTGTEAPSSGATTGDRDRDRDREGEASLPSLFQNGGGARPSMRPSTVLDFTTGGGGAGAGPGSAAGAGPSAGAGGGAGAGAGPGAGAGVGVGVGAGGAGPSQENQIHNTIADSTLLATTMYNMMTPALLPSLGANLPVSFDQAQISHVIAQAAAQAAAAQFAAYRHPTTDANAAQAGARAAGMASMHFATAGRRDRSLARREGKAVRALSRAPAGDHEDPRAPEGAGHHVHGHGNQHEAKHGHHQHQHHHHHPRAAPEPEAHVHDQENFSGDGDGKKRGSRSEDDAAQREGGTSNTPEENEGGERETKRHRPNSGSGKDGSGSGSGSDGKDGNVGSIHGSNETEAENGGGSRDKKHNSSGNGNGSSHANNKPKANGGGSSEGDKPGNGAGNEAGNGNGNGSSQQGGSSDQNHNGHSKAPQEVLNAHASNANPSSLKPSTKQSELDLAAAAVAAAAPRPTAEPALTPTVDVAPQLTAEPSDAAAAAAAAPTATAAEPGATAAGHTAADRPAGESACT